VGCAFLVLVDRVKRGVERLFSVKVWSCFFGKNLGVARGIKAMFMGCEMNRNV
jgi:hypothetical protein